MTAKLVKNGKGGTRETAACLTDVLTTFWGLLKSITLQTHRIIESFCFP